MSSHKGTVSFFKRDYLDTLFPLETNRLLFESIPDDIAGIIREKILNNPNGENDGFLPQVLTYAAKHGLHTRRTMKLDPIAEFFIYDLVHRNRSTFRKDFSNKRVNFGYRFTEGNIIEPRESYRAFKGSVRKAAKKYKYWIKCDISSYFNSIYHHDLVFWFSEDDSRSNDDKSAFGLFLRQINLGRSLDCLPQGIMPCKVLGSHFLKFIDNSHRIKSDLLLRYMDDIYLFDNKERVIIEDFGIIQRMLGDKGLSVNAAKTKIGEVAPEDFQVNVDAMRLSLLRARRMITEGYSSPDSSNDDLVILTDEQTEYLYAMLKNPEIEEEDAELVLSLMGDYSVDVLEHLELILAKFPYLIRNVYHYCENVDDINALAEILERVLSDDYSIGEYQLFWMAMIVEDYLPKAHRLSGLYAKLLEHRHATLISKAKVLEITESRFGMPDLRYEYLRTGSSDWLSWASAIGCRNDKPAKRNHSLGYFANGGTLNKLISQYVRQL